MSQYFKLASVLSFIGAAAFILVVIETGKVAFLGFTVVMLCNGISLWKKSKEKSSDLKEQNVGEKNNE